MLCVIVDAGRNLPQDHPLRLGRKWFLLRDLKEHVQCRTYCNGDPITPSGIPPHVTIIRNMEVQSQVFNDRLNHLDSALAELQPNMLSGIRRVRFVRVARWDDKFDRLTGGHLLCRCWKTWKWEQTK